MCEILNHKKSKTMMAPKTEGKIGESGTMNPTTYVLIEKLKFLHLLTKSSLVD